MEGGDTQDTQALSAVWRTVFFSHECWVCIVEVTNNPGSDISREVTDAVCEYERGRSNENYSL